MITPPASLALRSAAATTSNELTVRSAYKFKFYVNTNIEAADAFIVAFPQQFMVNVANGSELSCSAQYYDEAAALTVDEATAHEISASTTSCTINKNFVSYTAGTLASAVDLDATDRVELTLSDVENARWGFTRTANGDGISHYDVDANAITAALFTSYKYWSTTFDVCVYDTTAKAVTFRSFSNMNSAYVGYADSATERYSLAVSSWNAMTGEGRITVNEGSQSDERSVKFSNALPLIADTLTIASTFTGTGLSLYVANSTTDWSYALLDDEVEFRVTAPAGTAVGYQYITWSISSETKESCQTNAIYGPGPRVLVEVIDTTSVVSIPTTVSTYNNNNSYPLTITLEYPPASDLTVNIVFTGNTAKLNATSVSFAPGETTGYMTLLITNATSATYTGTLSLTGTNKDSYTIAGSIAVTVAANPTTPTIAAVTLTESSVGSNSAILTVGGGADGISYLSLKCSQTASGYRQYHTLAEMKAVAVLGEGVMVPTMEDDIAYNTTSDSFYQYLKDIYQMNCYTEYFLALPHVSSSSVYTVDWLNDGTYYTANAWVESSLGMSSNTTKVFTTSATQTQSVITVTVTSLTDVTATAANTQTIACQLADALQVPSYFLLASTPTSLPDSTNAALFIGTYTYTVLYNRMSSNYNPALFISTLDTSDTAATTKTALGLTASTDIVAISTPTNLVNGAAPAVGTTLPTRSSTGDGSFTFTWTPDNTGRWCTACVRNGQADYTEIPLPEQIAFGLSARSNEAGYTCMSVTGAAASTLTVSGLDEIEDYNCYHAICNTNVLFPSCTAVVLTSYGPYETDSASILALFSIALALIFN